MERDYWKKITSTVMLGVLIVLSFLLLKPILISIITGIILAFLFTPIYNRLTKRLKSRNLAATLICAFFLIAIVVLLWAIVPVLITQSIEIFIGSQSLDFVTPLKTIFPSVFSYDIFSNQIGSVIESFVVNLTSSIMGGLADMISNFPTLFLQSLVVIFTFFFVLRDNEKFVNYIQSILPFPKEVEKKLFKSSRDITYSVLYGQIIIGILQGFFAGISFFLFGVGNALFLTLLASFAGIFPIIGTSVVWIPVVVFLFAKGNLLAAIGVLAFGLVSVFLENAVKPSFVSKRTNVHSAIILLGMVGGLFFIGILGFIIGPLILAYLLIVLEIYRDKRVPGVFIEPAKK